MADTRPLLPAQAGYVAMGSSFAAGAGIGPLQAGSPARCQRTVNNYASLIAAQFNLTLRDVSCGGATTDHIVGSWDELPPQVDAVQADTRLVTITIGGNDLGYVGLLFGGSCRAGVAARPGPCSTPAAPSEADYRKLEDALVQTARAVHARAPQARVIFVQYVRLIPQTLCAATAISPAEAADAAKVGTRLAAVTRMAARRAGAEVLDADALSARHTACDALPWSQGLSPAYRPGQGAPWHPNAAGHKAIAEALAERL